MATIFEEFFTTPEVNDWLNKHSEKAKLVVNSLIEAHQYFYDFEEKNMVDSIYLTRSLIGLIKLESIIAYQVSQKVSDDPMRESLYLAVANKLLKYAGYTDRPKEN